MRRRAIIWPLTDGAGPRCAHTGTDAQCIALAREAISLARYWREEGEPDTAAALLKAAATLRSRVRDDRAARRRAVAPPGEA